MTRELVEIGTGRGFMTVEKDDERTREIGHRLDRLGGMELMQRVHANVSQQLPYRARSRELERAWDGIGDWRG